jgi:hypothetical protein
MRTCSVVLSLIVVALLATGCAINTKALAPGMSTDAVTNALGQPVQISEGVVGNNQIAAWDYSRDGLGIPNPIDDYWWVIPPTTNVVRLWFLNGVLKQWQVTKVRDIDDLKESAVPPEWRTPPDLKSPDMPEFIRELQKTATQ